MKKYILSGFAALAILAATAVPAVSSEVKTEGSTQVVAQALKKLAQADDASACANIPTSELGRCTLDNPPEVLNNLNCPACCAHRNALTWISANHNVACQ
ncbi:hypothetical protein [Afifella marina]|uniref:Uncharacterized protein n=1 Tax=Afifella marina DSM 2698 TaxID=1120955 RepID=A0A1G5MFU9_AFIMA|nr:hypothetical protein [Afifella marina]MBK1622570.1 hypothetical protein [Afifella marina DSM 2698]MBK1625565.1 hypothetical protein [Afifella marina]MBK5917388.1 hypothetical protein [Afifella marina]RAI23339.1 hypothetical protein CH311_00135 [Afifella marina DSM 2698]SCZ23388.1 hypothetical protein SAMN03080610_00526 [Afifella marina DSM 2698]